MIPGKGEAMAVCRQCWVSGRVQGVYFRGATQRRAEELGRVEVLACGAAKAVASLCEWLWEGPPSARVTAVSCVEVETELPGKFTMG